MDISWYDAILFCNLLSRECGLEECYTYKNKEDDVFYNEDANGYRLPTDGEWQYACKADSSGYRYGEIDDIAWFTDHSDGNVVIHRLKLMI